MQESIHMSEQDFDESKFSFISVYRTEYDLEQYGRNALSAFAMSLYLRLEDYHEFAANAITEGPEDKKVDICYIDENDKRVIIAQSYLAETWGKKSAPSNKASDLNTAIGWLFSASLDLVPLHLRAKASELRRFLENGDVKRIEILFIHNCFESENVERELKTAADVMRAIADAHMRDRESSMIISYRELGLKEIEELYKSRDSDILVDDWIEVPASNKVEERGIDWRAILTSVTGDWIRELRVKHGDRLFSANYRDYLGYVKRQGNINFQITQTAESEPANFWVYNNGITALTHELKIESDRIRIRGISIINGAQTTGALGDAAESATVATKVLIRIVECRSKPLIDSIIRYNNTQNEIKPSDTRSNDQIQKRLATDFLQYQIRYQHRRSAARNPRNAITAAAIAPALCAFHGDPQTAYRNAKDIFNDDEIYQRVFPNNIRAEHVFLIKALSTAIDDVKNELKKKVSEGHATQLEDQENTVLKYSASKHFIFYIVGALAEEIMKRRIPDLHEWKCKPEVISAENTSLVKAWGAVLHALLPHIASNLQNQGEDAAYEVPRSMERTKMVVSQLKALVASIEPALRGQFNELRRRTLI
jgi:hypothetical protein